MLYKNWIVSVGGGVLALKAFGIHLCQTTEQNKIFKNKKERKSQHADGRRMSATFIFFSFSLWLDFGCVTHSVFSCRRSGEGRGKKKQVRWVFIHQLSVMVFMKASFENVGKARYRRYDDFQRERENDGEKKGRQGKNTVKAWHEKKVEKMSTGGI